MMDAKDAHQMDRLEASRLETSEALRARVGSWRPILLGCGAGEEMIDPSADIAILESIFVAETAVINAALVLADLAKTPFNLAFRAGLLDLVAACERLRAMEKAG